MLANCSRCGQLYTKSGKIIVCSECITEEETVFEEVKSYLRSHKMATLAEVVTALEADPILVSALIEEGRLDLVDYPNFGINCRRCGTLTNAGPHCKKCQSEITQEFAEATIRSVKRRTEKEDHGPGYYTR